MVGPIVSLGLDTAFLKYANNVLKEIVGSALMYLMQQDEPNPNKIACQYVCKNADDTEQTSVWTTDE